MENSLPKMRQYTNYKLSEKGKEIDNAPLQICKSAELAEISGSRSGSYQVEIEYALEVATNEHLVKSAKMKYEEGCDLIKLDDPNIGDNARKEHAVFYLYKTLMDSKCIADHGNTKNVATSSSGVSLQVSDPHNTNNLVTPSFISAVASSGERNCCEEHNFAIGASLDQVEELVDGMVTESSAVTDKAQEIQAISTRNSYGNFHIKQELQSGNEEDHPAPLNVCPVSIKSEHLFETEPNQNLPMIKSVESLRQPVVEQHQNGGLSQPKGLSTPSTQLIAHHDADMEDLDLKLENIEKHSTIDPVNVKKEMEHDEYYMHDVVHQRVNTENRTSDIVTSVQLEENVGSVLDGEGRNVKIEGRKEESLKGKMTSDEREVVIWNQENTSSEVAELDDHGENLFGRKRSDSKCISTERPHGPQKKKKAKLQCDVCGYRTNWKSHLTRHMRTHRPTHEKLFACDVCGFATTWKSNLTSHMRTHCRPTQEKPFACDACGYTTNWRSNLTSHMRTHSPTQGKLFACDVCGYRTNWKSSLTAHKRTHGPTQEKPFACDACGFTTNWKANLSTHMRMHRPTEEKLFACNACGYATKWKSNLTSHIRTHGATQEKLFACDVCSYTTKWKANLSTHMRMHRPTEEKLFACDVCGFSTKWKSNLRNHKLIHTKGKRFVCEVCGHSSNQKADLLKHMETHADQEKPFVCELCGFSTNSKSDLCRHIQTHADQGKQFVCEVCGLSTKWRSTLANHKRIHTQEKPFMCKVCGFATKWSRGLLAHIRTHSGETPFMCKTCNMEFTDASNLRKHITTQHDKNAPVFQCGFCKYLSKDKKETKRHEIRIHTKQYPYKCNHCNHGYLTQSLFHKHMKQL